MEHRGRRAASLPRFQLLSILSASVRIIPSSAILFHFFLLPFTCSSKPPANDTIRVDIVTSSDVTGHHHHSMDQAISIDHR